MTRTLDDLPVGAAGVLATLEVGPEAAGRLMELGFLPGARIEALRGAPGGDPRVFKVDGALVALRRETARFLILRAPPGPPPAP